MIYHITDAKLWERALELGDYSHPSLKAEGFIHCSTLTQLPATVARFFSEAQSLIILHIVERRIKELVRWEESDGDKFPHIYGQLPLEAIEDLSIIERDDKGQWDWQGLVQPDAPSEGLMI